MGASLVRNCLLLGPYSKPMPTLQWSLEGWKFLMSEVTLWSISLLGKAVIDTRAENNYFTEMCSGSEAGSYSGLIDFVNH